MINSQRATSAVLISGAFLSVLNQTMMNPILPNIMSDFGINTMTAQWLVSGFTFVNAIVVAVSAFLMDRFKTKPLFVSSFLLFFIGSLMVAWGINFPILLLGRILQAICAGVMIPLSMTTLLVLSPHEKRGAAMGAYSFVIMFAPAIGPALSGLLTDRVGWHYTFLIITVLAAVMLVTGCFIKDYSDTKNAMLDKPSLILCVAGLFGLLYGFSKLGHAETLAIGAATLAAGVVILIFFSRRQLKLANPFLEIGILRDKQFRMGVVVLMIISASLTATIITLPLYVQTVRGMSATASGMIMMPGAIVGAITGFYAGRLSDKFGPRILAITGIVLLIIGSVGMVFWDFATPLWVLVIVYCVRYIGLMLTNTPINLWAIGKLPNEILNHGNAVGNTLRQIAATLGTVVTVAVMSLAANMTNTGGVRSQLFGIQAAFYWSAAMSIISFFMIFIYVKKPAKPLPQSAEDLQKRELSVVMNVDPLTLMATDTLAKAVAMFIENRKSGLPVVDDENRLVGYVSSGSVIRYLANQDVKIIDADFTFVFADNEETSALTRDLLRKNVMEAADKRVFTVEDTASLSQICRLFNEHKLTKIPVVTQENRVVGTISRIDVIRYMMSQLPLNQ